MSNDGREAFEAWARSSGVAANDRGCDNFFSETMRIAYEAWQAARDHFAPKANDESYTRVWNEAMDYAAEVNAPKLSQKEAVEAAAKAIQQRYWKGDLPISIEDAKEVCTEFAMAALRAAGVRFKESGSAE
jgi:hypothetical protein